MALPCNLSHESLLREIDILQNLQKELWAEYGEISNRVEALQNLANAIRDAQNFHAIELV